MHIEMSNLRIDYLMTLSSLSRKATASLSLDPTVLVRSYHQKLKLQPAFTNLPKTETGKSTLLRLLVGKEKPEQGIAGIVGQNVDMNYFEQNQADALDLDKTVLETIQGASGNQSYNELRALLGQFLFKGDAVDKKVSNLSGGEKARLSLCCMMLRPANLLILDEPYVILKHVCQLFSHIDLLQERITWTFLPKKC